MGELVDLISYRRARRRRVVYFSRRELTALLGVFSRHVLSGEWRDYSIDNSEAFAAFCVYRRAHDEPLYKILRLTPKAHPKGEYLLMRGNSRIRRADSLAGVLGALTPALRAVQGGC